MKILLSDWMRKLDSDAIDRIGIPSTVLMENAASGTAEFIKYQFPKTAYPDILTVVGPGNNGGDGITVARKLFAAGYKIQIVCLTDPDKYKGDPLINFNIIRNIGISFEYITEISSFKNILSAYNCNNSLIVDAIFGTGLIRPVKDSYFAEVIDNINLSGIKVASVDLPSGLSEKFASSEGSNITAEITSTFQTLKISHLFPDTIEASGKIKIIDIGIPEMLLDKKDYYIELITKDNVKPVFTTSHKGDHKGVYGHSLIIAGSDDKPGAAIMASISSLRSGAGLVTCASALNDIEVIAGANPEIMVLNDLTPEKLISEISGFNVVLAGPGMGINSYTKIVVEGLLKESKKPLILDADALNIMEGDSDILKRKIDAPVILTPHPKEFSRISGYNISEIVEAPYKFARNFSMEFNVYLILKGHRTIISTPDGKVFVNQTGNSGMATAGSGDVLSGIISGLIARNLHIIDMETILKASVFIHGFAGDLAKQNIGEVGMTATDIVKYLPEAIKRIDDFKTEFFFG